jgi:hypothetical protein
MTTLREWLADDEIAETLLDARIVKATMTEDGKLALVLELRTDEQDDDDG